jgi:hypothetical protein
VNFISVKLPQYSHSSNENFSLTLNQLNGVKKLCNENGKCLCRKLDYMMKHKKGPFEKVLNNFIFYNFLRRYKIPMFIEEMSRKGNGKKLRWFDEKNIPSKKPQETDIEERKRRGWWRCWCEIKERRRIVFQFQKAFIFLHSSIFLHISLSIFYVFFSSFSLISHSRRRTVCWCCVVCAFCHHPQDI